MPPCCGLRLIAAAPHLPSLGLIPLICHPWSCLALPFPFLTLAGLGPFFVLDLPDVATRWRGRDALPELRGVRWEQGLESSRSPPPWPEGKVG